MRGRAEKSDLGAETNGRHRLGCANNINVDVGSPPASEAGRCEDLIGTSNDDTAACYNALQCAPDKPAKQALGT
jgi:hypothetical protein